MNEVYKITNIINNKVYIGITNQGFMTRYAKHKSDARHESPFPIHNAIRKYGEDNFIIEVIDLCDTYDQLKEIEKLRILEYNSTDRTVGYNISDGGDGTPGRILSCETKEKIRKKAIGRVATEETKKKMSETHKNIPVKRNIEIQKSVLQLDLENNIIAEYDSMRAACRSTGLSNRLLDRCLKKGYRNKDLYIWRFKSL